MAKAKQASDPLDKRKKALGRIQNQLNIEKGALAEQGIDIEPHYNRILNVIAEICTEIDKKTNRKQ